MLLAVFGQYYFLQSLGWGIANSLWQAGLLWMIYQLIVAGNKKLGAVFKHHLSLLLLVLSFVWFTITTIQNYSVIQHSGGIASAGWLYTTENLDTALQCLSVLYIGLLLLYTVQFTKRFTGLYFIQNRQLLKAPVSKRIFTEQTALHMGISKKVSIWLSENVDVPSVVGFFKPVILLPIAALNHLTTAQAESIILHELAHIKRNDYLVNLLQSFIELILFFNPFARLLGIAARKERENCCDDWVVNYQYSKHDYAAALLLLEQQRHQPVNLALAATSGKKNLLGRIQRLFAAAPQTSINHAQQIKLAVVCMTLLAVMFFILPTIIRLAPVIHTAEKKHTLLPSRIATKFSTGKFNELKSDKTINNQLVEMASVNKKINIQKKQLKKEISEVEYSTALVNEELLNAGKVLQNISVPASVNEPAFYPRLLVQVEEEQSGIKEKNTYVLRLNKNNGHTVVEPLFIINKKMKAHSGKVKKTDKAIQANSIKLNSKRRITS